MRRFQSAAARTAIAAAAFTAMAITPAQARFRQARIFRYVAFAWLDGAADNCGCSEAFVEISAAGGQLYFELLDACLKLADPPLLGD
jgi:hypothetical protein